MSRYRGPRLRVFKSLGPLPGFGLKLNQKYLDQKYKQKKKEYSQSTLSKNTSKKKKKLPYTIRLKEKQKLRFHYGLTEKQLIRYVRKARQKTGIPRGNTILTSLEMRLDNIVFRLGFAPTLPAARQLITHGHIFLNGKKRNIPSSQCKIHDRITRNGSKTTELFHQIKPEFLNLDSKNMVGKVQQNASRKYIGLKINELLVIEYYSRYL